VRCNFFGHRTSGTEPGLSFTYEALNVNLQANFSGLGNFDGQAKFETVQKLAHVVFEAAILLEHEIQNTQHLLSKIGTCDTDMQTSCKGIRKMRSLRIGGIMEALLIAAELKKKWTSKVDAMTRRPMSG
jgi:hypothetical protein